MKVWAWILIGFFVLFVIIIAFGGPVTREPPPSKCAFEVPFECVDYSIGKERLSFTLENVGRREYNITGIEMNGKECEYGKEENKINIECYDRYEGRIKIYGNVSYYENGFEKRSEGVIVGTVR